MAYDHEGKLLFSDISTNSAGYYKYGYMVQESRRNEWVIYDVNGQKQLEYNCKSLYPCGSEHLFRFRDENGLYGFIDINGDTIVPAIYSNLYGFYNNVALGILPIDEAHAENCLIDTDGNILFKSSTEQSAIWQDNGILYLVVPEDDVSMLFDYDALKFIPLDDWYNVSHMQADVKAQFSTVLLYHKQIYIVKKDDEWLFTDNQGNTLNHTKAGEPEQDWLYSIELNRHYCYRAN